MRERMATLWDTLSMPKMLAVPAVGRVNPSISLIVVVLPAPFGPRKPKIEFWCTFMSNALSA